MSNNMAFYKSISPWYNYIFPLKQPMVNFVLDSLNGEKNQKVLDIGCATGLLSQAIGNDCGQVIGIDLDTDMVWRAKQHNAFEHVTYLELNMLNLEELFREGTFDRVLCFGNTMVHLRDQEEIKQALTQIAHVLKPGGKFLMQILNYRYILDEGLKSLPLIDNDYIKFERFYSQQVRDERFIFETRLTVKDSGEVISNEIYLYPLLKDELDTILSNLGYTDIKFYSNFNKQQYHYDHLPLVVEATRG